MILVLGNKNYKITSREDAINHRDFFCDYLGYLKTVKKEWQDIKYNKADIRRVNVYIKNVINAIAVINDYLLKS